MAIITGDFVTRLSGGAANAVGDAALGGAKSANAAATTLDALFDLTTAAQAAAGTVEYRCIYLHNANAADTMTNAVFFMSANTPLAGTTIDIGIGSSALNGIEQTIANETTAPTGVAFTAPTTAATGIALGNIPFGQHRAIWARRTVTAGALNSINDTYTIGYQCETA